LRAAEHLTGGVARVIDRRSRLAEQAVSVQRSRVGKRGHRVPSVTTQELPPCRARAGPMPARRVPSTGRNKIDSGGTAEARPIGKFLQVARCLVLLSFAQRVTQRRWVSKRYMIRQASRKIRSTMGLVPASALTEGPRRMSGNGQGELGGDVVARSWE